MSNKKCVIIISKDASDPREQVFAGLNGTNLSIPVGCKVTVPFEIYDKVLSQGNLKDRVTLIASK